MTHLRLVNLDEERLPLKAGDLAPEILEAARLAAQEHAHAMAEKRRLPGPAADQKKRRRGPTRLRLYPELQARIVDLVRRGNYPTTAAVSQGIPDSTWQSWMAKGREARALSESGGKLTKTDELYRDLLGEVEAAWHDAEVKIVDVVQRLATGEVVSSVTEVFDDDDPERVKARTIHFVPPHPTTSRWMLEKMAPDRWGRNRIEVTGQDGGPIDVEVALSAREALREKLGLAAERMGLAKDEPDT